MRFYQTKEHSVGVPPIIQAAGVSLVRILYILLASEFSSFDFGMLISNMELKKVIHLTSESISN